MNTELGLYKAQECQPVFLRLLKDKNIRIEMPTNPPKQVFPRTSGRIWKAVKRWFYNDWRRIETKLRTSIVEGISVFLSLFDDNPVVKRTFCPPKECYDPRLNADFKYGRPLPSFPG